MSSIRIGMWLPILCSLVLTTSAFADSKSAKKKAADQNEVDMAPPQVLEKGDGILGARLGVGDAWGGDAGIGANYEYMFHPNFGISGQLDYSSYSAGISWPGYVGKWSYTAWTIAVLGNWHFDAFKVKNLDTFVSLGIGHTFLSASWSSNYPSPGNADASATFVALYANARYFFNSHWGGLISLGTGLGTVGLGVDYIF